MDKHDPNKPQKIWTKKGKDANTLVDGYFIGQAGGSHLIVEGGVSLEKQTTHILHRAREGVILVMLLEGELKFAYDGQDYHISASTGPTAIAVTVDMPASFRRVLQEGNRVRKVNLVLTKQWFERKYSGREQIDLNPFKQWLPRHLSRVIWQPNKQIIQWCEELLVDIEKKSFQHHLKQELLGTQIVCDFLENAEQMITHHSAQVVNLNQHPKIESAIAYIEQNIHQVLVLPWE